eukprot:7592937-Alexandrium_andersonii.AAC.1
MLPGQLSPLPGRFLQLSGRRAAVTRPLSDVARSVSTLPGQRSLLLGWLAAVTRPLSNVTRPARAFAWPAFAAISPPCRGYPADVR